MRDQCTILKWELMPCITLSTLIGYSPAPIAQDSDFYVVQTPADTHTSQYSSSASSPQSPGQTNWSTGRSTTVVRILRGSRVSDL